MYENKKSYCSWLNTNSIILQEEMDAALTYDNCHIIRMNLEWKCDRIKKEIPNKAWCICSLLAHAFLNLMCTLNVFGF